MVIRNLKQFNRDNYDKCSQSLSFPFVRQCQKLAPSPQEGSVASSQNMTNYSKFMQRQPYIATEPTYLQSNILLDKNSIKIDAKKKRITCDSNPPGSRSGLCKPDTMTTASPTAR